MEKGKVKVIDIELALEDSEQQMLDALGKSFIALLQAARNKGGYVVGYLPLMKIDLSGPYTGLSDEDKSRIVNCRGILESLREEGPLSAENYEKARQELGTEGDKIAETIPSQGKPLFCLEGILELLVDAGLLSIASERFEIFIGKNYYEHIKTEIMMSQKKEETGRWLKELMDKLRRGIDENIYRLLPPLQNEKVEEPILRCLLSLLQLNQHGEENNCLLWIDDRCLTGYRFSNGLPVVGINEILALLVRRGILTENEYYDKIHCLRAGNARFIPLTTKEILHELRQATVGKEKARKIVETKELAVLRRYIAVNYLQTDLLQPALLQHNQRGEQLYLTHLTQTIKDVLVDIWAEEKDERICQLYADWIVNNLYLNLAGVYNALKTTTTKEEKAEYKLLAADLASLVSQAIRLESSVTDKKSSSRYRYLVWLYHSLLQKKFKENLQLSH